MSPVVGAFLGLAVAVAAAQRLRPARVGRRSEAGVNVMGVAWALVLTALWAATLGTAARVLAETSPLVAFRAEVEGLVGKVGVFLAAAIVADFFLYWTHRWNHSRLLWPTHAFHHSPTHMTWLSGFRETPVHHLLILLPALVGEVLFTGSTGDVWLAGTILLPVLNTQFIHANIDIKLPGVKRIFVTPDIHRVHHATSDRAYMSNFGFVFVWWDKLFGTYMSPAEMPADYPLGRPTEQTTAQLLLGVRPARGAAGASGLAPRKLSSGAVLRR